MSNLSLHAIICGMRKHARLQNRREIGTHYGLTRGSRRVADVSAEELPIPAREERTFAEPDMRRRRRRRVLSQLFEFTQNPQYRTLLWRRLFQGVAIETLAEALNINPATARSIVKRGRAYLGIEKRTGRLDESQD